MKKLVGLLLSIWIPLYFLFALLGSCKKSVNTPLSQSAKETTSVSEGETQKNTVLGSWLLVEYYEDNGNGSGQWMPAHLHEDINFYEDGSFLANSEYPVFKSKNYTQYTIVDSAHIDLSSPQTEQKTTFHYVRESETSLVFHPLCRENCSRRYQLIK
jgi:hypothetical protein